MVAMSGGCSVTEGLLTGISWANADSVMRKTAGAKAQALDGPIRHGWKPCPPVAARSVGPTHKRCSHVFTFRPPGLVGRELFECCSRFQNGSPARTPGQ